MNHQPPRPYTTLADTPTPGGRDYSPTAIALFALLWAELVWPFRIAAVIATLAALEEIAITCLLDAPRDNVRGVRAVWRERAGR